MDQYKDFAIRKHVSAVISNKDKIIFIKDLKHEVVSKELQKP